MTTPIVTPTVKRLILILAEHGPMRPATVGHYLFPVTHDPRGFRLTGARNAQGAALSAGKHLHQAAKAGLIYRGLDGSSRWKLSTAGSAAAIEWSNEPLKDKT